MADDDPVMTPCPRCGAAGIEIDWMHVPPGGPLMTYAVCPACDFFGPEAPAPDGDADDDASHRRRLAAAADAWNARGTPPAPDGWV